MIRNRLVAVRKFRWFFLLLVLGINCKVLGQNTALAVAKWISPVQESDTVNRACPIFIKKFLFEGNIKKAELVITAHGLYEAEINNLKVGNAYFTPGFTDYAKRLQYQRYDITRLLQHGGNQLEVTLADGWYRGVFRGRTPRNIYGKDISLLCRLDITYENGLHQYVNSDSSWLCGTGPIRYADFYNGEVEDTRVIPGNWSNVKVEDFSKDKLVPTVAEPVTEQETFSPKRIFRTQKNEQVIDFGQNMAGWVRVKIKGKPGDTIKLYHAEVLDKDGNFYTGNLREAKAVDTYVLNGAEQVLQPHFTYHGFRYVKAVGFTATADHILAVAVHSDLKHTGSFSCSNPMLNQLQHNIEWSLNSNFVDIPTDCPQRSERLGWTGDAQVFCRTAAFNRDVNAFFSKYLADVSADQGPNGGVPDVIPDVDKWGEGGTAGWSDAATIIPWTLYEVYGDTAILHKQYASMKAWVDYILKKSKNSLYTENTYGDWLAPGPGTGLPYIDQCFWAYSTQLVINAAKVLGKTEDAARYEKVLQEVKAAFIKNYTDHRGNLSETTQTAAVLALQFDLLPDSSRQRTADGLARMIKENNNHLATGFLGTPYLLPVLSRFGYTDLAYTSLLQKTVPSWLYPVTMGATTIWERWDGIKPDGTVQATSYNHYSYGSVGQWLYESIAGISSAAPGYKTIRIAPHIGGGLTWAKGSYECRYGKIVSEWQRKGRQVSYYIVIPKNTVATIELPGESIKKVHAGIYRYTTNTPQL